MRVGWIGLGQMGTPMALAVAAAGHDVIAHVRSEHGRDAVRDAGIRLTRSLVEVASGVDILCVAVFDDAQLLGVLEGPDGALAALPPGSIVSIHTTGSPRVAQHLAAIRPDVEILDATFSGVAEQAAKGGLTLMIGGDADALARAKPVHNCYANKIIHTGPVGSGQQLKLINNTLFAANLALAADALRIAQSQGLDPAQVARQLSTCSGASFALAVFSGDRTIADVMDQAGPYLIKDVAVAHSAAEDAGIDLGLLGQTAARFG